MAGKIDRVESTPDFMILADAFDALEMFKQAPEPSRILRSSRDASLIEWHKKIRHLKTLIQNRPPPTL
jgi:hypothetical protein